MATMIFGPYKSQGQRTPLAKKVKATSAAIEPNDILTMAAGLWSKATDGDPVDGVAIGAAASPASDGDNEVQVDISRRTLYRLPVVTGTLTLAMEGTTCDLGVVSSVQGLDVTASTNDDLVIVQCDVTNQEALVSILPARAGVV